jgi:hypothetical protein
MNTKVFIYNLTYFLTWNFLHCCQKLGPQILSLVNTKNKPMAKKGNHFPCNPFRTNYVAFKILISYIINQMHYNEHYQT